MFEIESVYQDLHEKNDLLDYYFAGWNIITCIDIPYFIMSVFLILNMVV